MGLRIALWPRLPPGGQGCQCFASLRAGGNVGGGVWGGVGAAPYWWHPVSWGCTGADAVCLRSQMASRLHGGVNSFSNLAHLFTALERLCGRLSVTFVTGVTGSERCLAPCFWRLASVEQLTGKPDFALSWRAGWRLKRLLKLRCFSPFLNHPCTLSASRSRTI